MTLPLLILRPEPGASATAGRAAKLGLTTILYPLFDIRACAWEPPDTDSLDAMLLTSANAVRHGGPALALYKHLPVYAVGEATAQAARKEGFQLTGVGQSGAQAISDIMAQRAHARVFHPGGRDRRRISTRAARPTHAAGGSPMSGPSSRRLWCFEPSCRDLR